MNYFNENGIVFLEDTDFNDDGSFKYSQRGQPMLLMVFGTFCGHCKDTAPIFAQLYNRYKNTLICAAIQVDGGSSEQGAARLLQRTVAPQLSGIPAFLLYENSQFKALYNGPRTVDSLSEFAFSSGNKT
jgi:thiol-disulfide isomerase/thioredoxin